MFTLPPLASSPGQAAAVATGGRAGGHRGFADTLAHALSAGGGAEASARSALHADGGEVDPQAYQSLGALLGLHAAGSEASSEELVAALLGEDGALAQGGDLEGLAALLGQGGDLEGLAALLGQGGDLEGLAALLGQGGDLEGLA
ncbi:MAG: hypothetical protein ACQETV_04620, partial [Actinomycetota bacterium]